MKRQARKPAVAHKVEHRLSRSTAALVALLAATFAIKLIVVVQLKDHVLLQPSAIDDSSVYVGLARRVIAGGIGLGPGLYYVAPLYIYFLALFYRMTSSFDAIRIVQIALGTATVGLIFASTREWFGARAAWIAAGLAALTGLFTFYEIVLFQASIDPVLTAATLLALTVALRGRGRRWYVVAGVAFGLLCLNRPNAIVAVAGMGALLMIARRWTPAMLLVGGLVLALLPVGLRNVLVSHQWALLTSHGGVNFYIGNNADANGLFRNIPGMTSTIDGLARDTRRVAEAAAGRPLSEGEVSDYFSRLAWVWIREHPGAWIRLVFRKLGYVFNAQHLPLPLSYPFFAYDTGSVLRFLFVGPWLLIPLGLFGLVRQCWPDESSRISGDRTSYLIWIAFVPLYAMSVALFFASERYRLPLLVLLTVGAGAALDQLIEDAARGRRRTLISSIVAVTVLLVAVNWPLNMLDGDGRGEERVHMAENLAHVGQADEARAWVSRALASYPYPSLAHYRVGVQLANAQQYQPAIAELDEALRLDPSAAAVELALGQAIAGSGQVQEAIPHLRRAFDHDAEASSAGAPLASALLALGDRNSAEAVLRQLVTKPAPDAQVAQQLGNVAADMNLLPLAQAFFDRAVELASDSVEIRDRSGRNLLSQQRFDDAAREFAAAVRLAPRNVDELVRLAFVEFQLKRFADAATHVAAALAVDQNNATALELKKMIDAGRA